jgi:hypothetical protein
MKPFVFPVVAFAALLAPLSADTNAPEVSSAFLSESSVDVSLGPEPITVTIVLSDDDSGFKFGNVFLKREDGVTVVASYFDDAQRTDTGEGGDTYTITMEVPQFAEPGTWRVDLLVEDLAGNFRWLGPNDEPLPIPGDMTFNVDNQGDIDAISPELISSFFLYDSVNLDEQGATFTVILDINDYPSGFYDGFIEWYDPSNNPDFSLWTYFSHHDVYQGDRNSGTYMVDVILPADLAHGAWTFKAFMQDYVGNSTVEPIGELLVTDDPTPPTGPVPQTEFLAHAVDAVQYEFTTAGGGWVYQTSDSNDGVDAAMSLPIGDNAECSLQTTVIGPGTLRFDWRVDSEQFQDFLSVSVGEDIEAEISGNTAWATVSLMIPAGPQTITWSYLKGASGFSGLDRGWVDKVRFEADSDMELPVLQALRIDPRSVDLTSGPKFLTFTMEITDDTNGLSAGRLRLFDALDNEILEREFNFSDSTGNDTREDVYEVEVEIPDDTEFGRWRAEVDLVETISAEVRNYGPGGDPFPSRASEFFFAGDSNASDSSAPIVRAIAVTPAAVNVGNGDAVAIVTVQITDLSPGFQSGSLTILNPNNARTGSFNVDENARIEGDEFNGIYQIEVTVPEFAQPGTWSVGFDLDDFDGNYRSYPNDDDYLVSVDPTFVVANPGQIDADPPTVPSIDITPASIDTSGGPADIQVTLTLEDDFSGVQEAYLYFYNPSDEFQTFLAIRVDTLVPISSSGPLSNTYQLTRTLPQGSPAGQWRVRMFVADNVGNLRFYGAGETEFPETGDGYFTVGSTAASWFKQAMAGASLSGEDALLGADPDEDGWINALEVLFNSNPADPASSGSNNLSFIRDDTHLHLIFTIHPAFTITANGDFLEVSNGGAPPMRLTGQTHGALSGTWSVTPPVFQSGSTYRVSLALASGETGFVRLMCIDP